MCFFFLKYILEEVFLFVGPLTDLFLIFFFILVTSALAKVSKQKRVDSYVSLQSATPAEHPKGLWSLYSVKSNVHIEMPTFYCLNVFPFYFVTSFVLTASYQSWYIYYFKWPCIIHRHVRRAAHVTRNYNSLSVSQVRPVRGCEVSLPCNLHR